MTEQVIYWIGLFTCIIAAIAALSFLAVCVCDWICHKTGNLVNARYAIWVNRALREYEKKHRPPNGVSLLFPQDAIDIQLREIESYAAENHLEIDFVYGQLKATPIKTEDV